MHAAQNTTFAFIETLVAAGADMDVKNTQSRTVHDIPPLPKKNHTRLTAAQATVKVTNAVQRGVELRKAKKARELTDMKRLEREKLQEEKRRAVCGTEKDEKRSDEGMELGVETVPIVKPTPVSLPRGLSVSPSAFTRSGLPTSLPAVGLRA